MDPLIIIGGVSAALLWSRQKSSATTPLGTGVAGTQPGAPLANTTTRIGIPIGAVMENPPPGMDAIIIHPGDQIIEDAQGDIAYVIPGDLAARLDDETAMLLRAYVVLNPPDFQEWLDRYARFVMLRSDLHLEKLENPPTPDTIQPTPAMIARMGNAAYKVGNAINGVAIGRSVDLFGVGASVAGAIPGMNQDVISAVQAAALTSNAITAIAALNGVSINVISGLTGGAFLGTVTVASYPGLAAGVAAVGLGVVLMAVGLIVDIGFTIIGNKPDLQKAIDVALDVASLVCLFIPVIGWVIAIVIQLVKFLIDLFGDDLFGGGGDDHDLREALETARYGADLNPIFPQLANAYTPRELWRTIVEWGSGQCGGKQIVAMSVVLILKAGDTMLVGGQRFTVPPDAQNPWFQQAHGGMVLLPGNNQQPGGCPYLQKYYNVPGPGPFASMTNDEQAWALAVYAPINGVQAQAQAGIAQELKTQFNVPTQNLIKARTQPMREFLVTHGLTLDQIDMIAMEHRAQPRLHAMARAFGWYVIRDQVEGSWQVWFSAIVHEEWDRFNAVTTHGSLSDFAKENGYPTMYAFRAAAIQPWESWYARMDPLKARLLAMTASYELQLSQITPDLGYGWGIA